MKVARQRTQFDHPESVGTPATPSCCCCCCCCLATIVSSTAMGSITANHQAKRFNRPSGWPTFVALFALPAAVLVISMIGSTTREGVVAVIGGAFAAMMVWFFAFRLAAPGAEPQPLVRSFKYVILFAGFFAAELFIGFFLVILYVVPYLIVAALISFFAIRAHLKSQRAEVAASMTPPPPTWMPPPPPPGTPASRPTTMFSADQGSSALGPGAGASGAPAAWPPRSDHESAAPHAESPAGSGPSFSLPPTSDVGGHEPPAVADAGLGQPSFEPPPAFEPPSSYQLPGYPAEPPQAAPEPGAPQAAPTYRPGNPSTHPPSSAEPPTDEQA